MVKKSQKLGNVDCERPHTGISCKKFFHWRVSWVSREAGGQAQGTIICLFVWSDVFRPKCNDIKKTYKNYQNPVKNYFFGRYYQSLFNFGLKTAAQTN